MFAAALLFGLLFVAVTLPPLVIEMASLVSNVPDWLRSVSGFLNERFGLDINLSNLSSDVINLQGALQTYAASLASGVLGVGSKVLGLVVQLFTMALFTFYLLADGPRFRRLVLSLVRPERQSEVRPYLGDRHRKDRRVCVFPRSTGARLGGIYLRRSEDHRRSVRPCPGDFGWGWCPSSFRRWVPTWRRWSRCWWLSPSGRPPR